MDKFQELYNDDNKIIANLSYNLDENIKLVKMIFDRCGDVVQKTFLLERGTRDKRVHVIYIDGLTNNTLIEDTIIKPLSYEWRGEESEELWKSILYREAQTTDIKRQPSLDLAVASVLKGDTVLLVEDFNEALVISSKRYPLRSISENDSELGLRGPKDSFNEGFRNCTALLRRRIKDSRLKVEQGTIGQRTRTDYALMYLEDVARPELLEELRKRIDKYEIDGIFDSGMAEHILEDNWFSPFPVFQATTRPDKVASGILEGRVALVFDNSPEVLIAPTNFNMLLQASDDYYNRWAVGTFSRFIRYIAAFLAITFPGLYIAVTVYHSEIIPTKLMYAIASARSMVTFPIIVEVLIMEFLFELLREAGIRLPGPLGNTIGVVGGLIVGQAAVDAGIVSTIVVIVVALTAIASFAIPNEEFASIFRLLKFFLIITSAVWGLYGFILSLLVLAVHLSELKSFGVPYMLPVVAGGESSDERQDFIMRSPIKTMTYRPIWSSKKQMRRLKRRRKSD